MSTRSNLKARAVTSQAHGCCVDGVCTDSTCMQLPAGTTCGDCVHIARCVALFGHSPKHTYCDWFPRRFVRSKDDGTTKDEWIQAATRELEILAGELAGTESGEEIARLARRGRGLLGEAATGGQE